MPSIDGEIFYGVYDAANYSRKNMRSLAMLLFGLGLMLLLLVVIQNIYWVVKFLIE